jgi:hypothetical protein
MRLSCVRHVGVVAATHDDLRRFGMSWKQTYVMNYAAILEL